MLTLQTLGLIMNSLLLVALGGALGASFRFWINLTMVAWFGKSFPYATLTVNIIGSFFMGLLFSAIEHGIIADQQWRALVGIGLLGAFTTFSTFSMDTLLLIQQQEWFKAILNILLNVFVCLFAAAVGMQAFAFKS